MGGSIGVWAGISCIIGILGLFVPFGEASVALGGGRPEEFMGFCGQGVPVPFIIWDKGADYPNPLALFFNPLCVFLIGLALIVVIKGCIWFGRREARAP